MSIYTFRNITNRLFSPVKAFDTGRKLFEVVATDGFNYITTFGAYQVVLSNLLFWSTCSTPNTKDQCSQWSALS